MSALRERAPSFDERSSFLALSLGLVAGARRLDAFLEEHGRASGSPLPVEHPVIDFVLGLISFRRTVIGALERARTTAAAPPLSATSDPEEVAWPLRGILR